MGLLHDELKRNGYEGHALEVLLVRILFCLFADDNGGQMVMGIPEFDLVAAFLGGNYSDTATFRAQREFVPQLLLSAVR